MYDVEWRKIGGGGTIRVVGRKRECSKAMRGGKGASDLAEKQS